MKSSAISLMPEGLLKLLDAAGRTKDLFTFILVPQPKSAAKSISPASDMSVSDSKRLAGAQAFTDQMRQHKLVAAEVTGSNFLKARNSARQIRASLPRLLQVPEWPCRVTLR